jgi:hypothetical protein
METQILTPISYDLLLNSAKPAQTESYFPISHGELINYIRERVDKIGGCQIVNEKYTINKDCNQMFGEMALSLGNTDARWAIGFRNSYDKSIPVGFVAGAQVIVCSNLMLAGEVKQVRRHTINLMNDIDSKFDKVQQNIEKNFQEITKEIDFYKESSLSFERAAELYGKILLRDSAVASVQQVTRAIQLFNKPINGFGNDTAWGFFNTFTEVFKEAHPALAPKNYLNLREFVNRELNYNKN